MGSSNKIQLKNDKYDGNDTSVLATTTNKNNFHKRERDDDASARKASRRTKTTKFQRTFLAFIIMISS